MDKETPPTSPDEEAKQMSFIKTRFDYSTKLFEGELSRKQGLETKAQFYVTLFTVFITAIFFSISFLTVLQGFFHNPIVSQFWRVAITVFIFGLGLALVFSLVSVLISMRIEGIQTAAPRGLYSLLFTPRADEFEEDDEAGFLVFATKTVVKALEDNHSYNIRKALWLISASYGILIAVLMLAGLVGISVYLQLFVVLPTPSKP